MADNVARRRETGNAGDTPAREKSRLQSPGQRPTCREALGLGAPLAAAIGIAVVMLLRLAAILWGLQLPVVAPRDE